MKSCVTCLLVLLLTAHSLAQTTTTVPTVEAVQGIGIGTDLQEARAVLARIGSGGGRDTRDGGRKEAWMLKETDFSTLAFKTNAKGKVVWISAFVRPGKQIPFESLGDLRKAVATTKSEIIWNVGSAQGGYRLVAKGAEGKASVIYLLSLDFPEMQ